jgi:4-amino-4-deoxy-L-arabinose transferase-like glycosyltransferase
MERMKILESKYDYFWIIILGLLVYLPFIGSVHLFDWDEINFAECAREMLATKDYLQVKINFQPFWEKPPLFIWMQVLSMKVFGINEFAARFPNVICGILTLLVVYDIGGKYISRKFGLYWVLAYLCSILPLLYFKSGIIDPWFNLFIFLSIWFFFRQIWWWDIIAGGIFVGLAILTKGPVAILLSLGALGIYVLLTKSLDWHFIKKIFVFLLVGIIVASVWFGLDIYYHGWGMTKQFLTYQIRLFQTEDAGHGGFLGYHFVVLLLGCFPASIFAIPYLLKKTKKELFADQILLLMQILFWVVLILFSIVKTKIVHYSSMCYIPLTFIAAYYIFKNENQLKLKKWVILVNVLIAIIVGMILLPRQSYFNS